MLPVCEHCDCRSATALRQEKNPWGRLSNSNYANCGTSISEVVDILFGHWFLRMLTKFTFPKGKYRMFFDRMCISAVSSNEWTENTCSARCDADLEQPMQIMKPKDI